MAKVVSVHSFRGGTGKSNMTANLAATVASKGLRVGIVDTDIQSPGIHVIFGLDEKQVKEINRVLRAKPSDAGMRVNLWDGKTLSAWIDKTYGVQLGVRQCQRLFRQFEFRLRKPRPVLARADPVQQRKHKKNSES